MQKVYHVYVNLNPQNSLMYLKPEDYNSFPLNATQSTELIIPYTQD